MPKLLTRSPDPNKFINNYVHYLHYIINECGFTMGNYRTLIQIYILLYIGLEGYTSRYELILLNLNNIMNS